MKKLIAIAAILAIAIFACKKGTITAYDCTSITPTYTIDIKPIMDASCATLGCHNALKKSDGKDYSTYASTKALASENGFMGSMQHKLGYSKMPKGGSKLSDAELQKIYCWVQNGTPQ
jgi:hypothetical protein